MPVINREVDEAGLSDDFKIGHVNQFVFRSLGPHEHYDNIANLTQFAIYTRELELRSMTLDFTNVIILISGTHSLGVPELQVVFNFRG